MEKDWKAVEVNSYIPLFTACVQAGFPQPADDHIDKSLDLNNYLIKHPAATFFVKCAGDSMINAGIFHNDLLIVDRALKPESGKVVIAYLNGEFTVKRLRLKKDEIILMPENPKYPPIKIPTGKNNESELIIWGIVTAVIHNPNDRRAKI
jgi:DNA polymerase V